MKSFKEIRKTLSEEYYSGPTAYAGGDRTNVGDITGTDLGGMGSGSEKTRYASTNNIKMIEAGLNSELAGVVKDPVTAITIARTKLNMTGLSFDINAKDINMAMSSGEPYVVNLNFGGRALGRDPGDEERDDFADDMGMVGQIPYEKTLPSMDVSFDIEMVGTGFKITASIVE